jgi:hypothetical protein
LAFCQKKKERLGKSIDYWETKKICRFFNDMDAG